MPQSLIRLLLPKSDETPSPKYGLISLLVLYTYIYCLFINNDLLAWNLDDMAIQNNRHL